MPHGGPNRKVCRCGNPAYKSGYCASCQLVINAERQGIARIFKQSLLDTQNGLCAWPPCGKPVDLSLYLRVHATDHDHRIWPKSNWIDHKDSVRGIVHPSCNLKIGYVEELRKDGHVVVSEEIAAYLDILYTHTGVEKWICACGAFNVATGECVECGRRVLVFELPGAE